jgi:cation-transporting ATPase 13A3/4/5
MNNAVRTPTSVVNLIMANIDSLAMPCFDFSADVLPSTDISPGDLIVLEANAPVPCDCILLNGNVVVNESSLTGESIPVMKSPLPKEEDDIFDPEHHGKYALFNGTTILQVKQGTSGGPVLALAFATGFFTLKGQLIRSIMFPKPTKFKFYKESFRFVLFLAGLGSYTSCQGEF